jgi:hypothetical protein
MSASNYTQILIKTCTISTLRIIIIFFVLTIDKLEANSTNSFFFLINEFIEVFLDIRREYLYERKQN